MTNSVNYGGTDCENNCGSVEELGGENLESRMETRQTNAEVHESSSLREENQEESEKEEEELQTAAAEEEKSALHYQFCFSWLPKCCIID